MAGPTFAQIREAAAEDESRVLVGTVTGVSPLSVQFGNVVETTNTVLVATSGYEPAVNDEVVCQQVGNYYVVLDKLGDSNSWVSWAPSFTSGASAGDGSFDGSKAVRIGTTCHFRMVFTLGSTSTVTGDVQVSTPYTMADSRDADGFRGTLLNTGVAIFLGVGQAASTTAFRVRAVDPSGTFSDPAALSSTIPFTWGSTDRMLITGTFEIA